LDEQKEKICQQIDLLAEVSRRENASVSEVIECSLAMAELYKVLTI